MDGFLLINKPKGTSSFGAVYKVRKIASDELRAEHNEIGICPGKVSNNGRCRCRVKVGHGGTLDPAATGLLVIAIGKATKQLDSFIGADKSYDAVIKLGEVSTTEDSEGEIRFRSALNPPLSDIKNVLENFIGKQKQMPPVYSALKVKGQRAYDLARQGKDVELKAREINIKDIKLLDYNYPYLKISCDVSKGTYIRSLAREVGEALNTGAYLAELKRTKIGNLHLKNAVEIEDLTPHNIYSNLLKIDKTLEVC